MNPYTRLKKAAKGWADKVENRHPVNVGVYDKNTQAIDGADFKTIVKLSERLSKIVEIRIVKDQLSLFFLDSIPVPPYEFY